MYVPVGIPYKSYAWDLPKLSPEQEIAMGEQIHRQGKKAFRQAFFASFKKPKPAPAEKPPTPKTYTGKDVAAVAATAALITGGVVVAPAIIIAGLGLSVKVLAMGGTMTLGSKGIALLKFSRWLRYCESKYLQSLKPAVAPPPLALPPPPVVLKEEPTVVSPPKFSPPPRIGSLRMGIAAFMGVSLLSGIVVVAIIIQPQSSTPPVTVATPAPEYRHLEHLERLEASRLEAERIYPDLLNPNSALSREVRNIIADMQARQDPALRQTDGPLRVAKIAALRITVPKVLSASPTPARSPTAKAIPRLPKAVASTNSLSPVKNFKIQFVNWSPLSNGMRAIVCVGGRDASGRLWWLSEMDAIYRLNKEMCTFSAETKRGSAKVYVSDKFSGGMPSLHTQADTPERFLLTELPPLPDK